MTIDAFTDRPFSGNPAAVCLLDARADPAWMQAVAAEMNVSETAFVCPQDDALALRWFTPSVEVDLCGHGTLAAAHALWTQAVVDPARTIRFDTRSGILSCTRDGDRIALDFPATPATQAQAPAGLLEALDAAPSFVGRAENGNYLVVLTESAVLGLRPDFDALRRTGVAGVIVTAESTDERFDFVSRYFAPNAGIDEDPVTGSAHCCLGPYWSERCGKPALTGFQASSRGGIVGVEILGDRATLRGRAVTVLSGMLSEAASAARADVR
jgi:PhzF family phenazine biosynthesis protein